MIVVRDPFDITPSVRETRLSRKSFTLRFLPHGLSVFTGLPDTIVIQLFKMIFFFHSLPVRLSKSQDRPAIWRSSKSCFISIKSMPKQGFRMSRLRHKVNIRPQAGMVDREIRDKTVVVTGGNRGIGLEFVKQFLKKQNRVIATSKALGNVTELQKLQTEFGDQNLFITELDVSHSDSIKKWAERLNTDVGLETVDLLINNAGVVGSDGRNKASFLNVDDDEMMFVFRVNAIGPLLVVQNLFKQKLIGKQGTQALIGNVTSKMGSVADNGSGGSYAYRSSKSAMNIINKSFSIDLDEYGITSVLLHPGYVRTDMNEGHGYIDVVESVAGMIGVLEDETLPLQGFWYDFAKKSIPW